MDYEGQPMDNDDVAYTAVPLNFFQTRTASTEICNSPWLEHKYGFCNKPNGWSVTRELHPVFSPSNERCFIYERSRSIIADYLDP